MIFWPLQLDILRRGAPHVGERRLPADDLRDHVRDQARIRLQLGVLVRILSTAQEAAGDRVARRVVAADDQQDQIAEILHAIHVARRFAVREHRDQIAADFWRIHAFVPQAHEIVDALDQFGAALVLGFDDAGILGGGRDVGPAGELAAILPGKVEQRRQHLGRQFDRDAVDPVELFAARQFVENLADAVADQAFHPVEVVRRDDRADDLALGVVLGRIHRDEHRQLEIGVGIADRDAAMVHRTRTACSWYRPP